MTINKVQKIRAHEQFTVVLRFEKNMATIRKLLPFL